MKNAARKNQQLADEIANQVEERLAKKQAELEGAPAGTETTERLTREEETRNAAGLDTDLDIFGYAERHIERNGDGVKYYVYLNNEMAGVIPHPCSWEQIQKQFGGGSFRIQAKSVSTGAYIRQERKVLAEPRGEEEPQAGLNFDAPTGLPSYDPAPVAPASTGTSLTEVLTLMTTMQEREEARRREERQRDEDRRREEREQRNDFVKTIIAAVSPLLPSLIAPKEKDNSSKLILDFMREQNRQQADQLNRVLEEMRNLQNRAPQGPAPHEQIKMLAEAEERGFKRASEMYDLVEEKAEAKAERMAESQGDGEESMTETLVKSLAPALGSALLAGKIGQPVAQPQAALPSPRAPQPASAPAPARAQVKPAQPKGPQTRPANAPARSVIQGLPRVATAKPEAASATEASAPTLRVVEAELVGETPAASPAAPGSEERPAAASVENRVDLSPEERASLQQIIVNTITPILGEKFLEMQSKQQEIPAATVAEESLKVLAHQGITLEQVLSVFTREEFDALVRGYGLPASLHPWLNSYYAHFESQAGVAHR